MIAGEILFLWCHEFLSLEVGSEASPITIIQHAHRVGAVAEQVLLNPFPVRPLTRIQISLLGGFGYFGRPASESIGNILVFSASPASEDRK